MSYVLTGVGAFWLFMVMIVSLSPRGEHLDSGFVIAAYAVGGFITLIGVILYIAQNKRYW